MCDRLRVCDMKYFRSQNSFLQTGDKPQGKKNKKNLNERVERHNECRRFHTGALHGTIKQLTPNHALWHVHKCRVGPVDSDLHQDGKSDFERGPNYLEMTYNGILYSACRA